jgi:MFS family permease
MSGDAAQSGEFKKGWPVVLSAAIGIALGLSPLPFYTIGVFVQPLSQEFGWTQSQIQLGLAVMTLTVVVASPFVGWLADRIGARPVALTSVFLFGLSLASFALLNGDINQFYLTWAAMGIMGAGTLPITWTRGVNSWFVANRGLALGFALVATGLGGALATQIAGRLTAEVGWREAYIGIAALPLLVSLPIALFMFNERKDAADAPALAQSSLGMTLGQAVFHWRFWLLAVAFVPISLALGGVVPNLVPILTSEGFTREQAIGMASLIGLVVAVGRVGGGWLIDRFWAPRIAFIMLAAPVIGLVELSLPGSIDYAFAVGAIVLIGLALGVEYDFMAFMTARYFGMRSYAAVYGALYGFFALGAGLGPVWYARMAEANGGDFGQALLIGGLMTLVGAAMLPILGAYPDFKKSGD